MDWKQQLNSLRQNLPEGNENIISETKKTNEKRQSTPVRIELDKRNGKPATIVSQIEAEDAEIEQIAKTLKIKCGAGGSVRDGEILIQGDFRQKIADLLSATGYKIRKINFSILAAVCLISLFTACKPETHDNDSEYISQVFEYMYAPGQHADSARPQDTIFFRGNPSKHEGWVYLGGFGGYIVAGFDHNIKNHAGADFEVFALSGNAPEPAVVYVMQDENNDGLPNDIWYELAGNQSNNSLYNYQLCYYKPENSEQNIRWKDNNGASGELHSGYNYESTAAWWWSFTQSDSIIFTGTRLPDAYENNSTTEIQNWIIPRDKFIWGYAENDYGTDYDSKAGSNRLDIANAIDSEGRAVNLPEIRFIKVQTAIFQQAGWLNEVSAEVRGAKEIK